MAEITAKKYEGLPRVPISSTSTRLLPISVESSVSMPIVDSIVPGVSSFCRPDDIDCNTMYDSIPWSELDSLTGSCSRSRELLEKLIRLKDLLVKEQQPLRLTRIWIKKLEERIQNCQQ